MKTRAVLQVFGLIFAILLLNGCAPAAVLPPAPTSAPAISVAQPGFITGVVHLSAPPTPRMVIYAVDPTSGLWAFAETQATDGEASFTLTVPPGSYQVFAFAADSGAYIGYSLDGTTLAFVIVAENQTVSNIAVSPPSQWACGSMFGVPASPDGRFAAVAVPTDCPAATDEALLNQQPTTILDGGRIQFQPNTDSWHTNGELSPNQAMHFVLSARQGQQMNVNLSTEPPSGVTLYASLYIVGADGTVFTPSPVTSWSGVLNATQDYFVEVLSISQQTIGYSVVVQIPAGGAVAPSSLSYVPISAEVCGILQETAANTVALAFSMEPSGNFMDPITGESGKGCILTAMATGMKFSDPASVRATLVESFSGWTEQTNYQADGPTGSTTAMKRDMGLLLITVDWLPSPDANCPADQPISACNLAPEQKLYTVQISAAQK